MRQRPGLRRHSLLGEEALLGLADDLASDGVDVGEGRDRGGGVDAEVGGGEVGVVTKLAELSEGGLWRDAIGGTHVYRLGLCALEGVMVDRKGVVGRLLARAEGWEAKGAGLLLEGDAAHPAKREGGARGGGVREEAGTRNGGCAVKECHVLVVSVEEW